MSTCRTLPAFPSLLSSLPMKSSFVIAALSLLASSTFTSASPLQARQNADCIAAVKETGIYNGQFVEACSLLVEDCANHADVTVDLWTSKSCVAAATCQGTRVTIMTAQCHDSVFLSNDVPSAVDQPHMDYNLYASIVGDCAWQPGGCPITQQNYIDFVYSALSDINSTQWPPSAANVVEKWWLPILDWTVTGTTLPYHNFDDWLHFSNS